jgi:Holliday junction resolvase RusA-like endonuclease
MKTPIRIVIPGPPTAKARAQIVKQKGGKAHGYTPKKTASYESRVYAEGRRVMGDTPPLRCPVSMQISINKPLPQSWPKWRKEYALRGLVRPAAVPDCSNVVKAVEDGLIGVVYVDDCQIVDADAEQWYAEQPEVIVTIYKLECCGPTATRAEVDALAAQFEDDRVRVRV